jgi:2',3'-cyclic-nucleotide 2'-phosphodiesterase (5'-nucleotidase family)
MNRRHAARIFAMALVLALVHAIARAEGDAPAPARPEKAVLTILHTNDWHGNAFAERRGRKDTNALTGGVVACAAAVAKIRAERPGAVLVLDGGDLVSGHPAASFVDDGVTGAAFVKLWAMIGFDAWVVGNHDLDHGQQNLRTLIGLVKPQALSANVQKADGSGPAVPTLPYKVFEAAGLKVGVVGLTTGDLPRLLPAAALAGVKVVEPAEAARPIVAELRPKVDVLLALTHLGVEADLALAKAVPGFDAIVGGHSHTRLDKEKIEGTTVIVQAGARGRELGRLDLTVEHGKVSGHEYRLLPLPLDEAAAPKEVVEASKKLEARVAELDAEVLGETTHALKRGNYYGPTDAGSFIADAIRAAAGTDVGFINSGGVRAEFPQGKVTRATLLAVMPFDDELSTFEASAKDLWTICRTNATAAALGNKGGHGILQVSGLRYRWRREGKKAVVTSVEVGGKPVPEHDESAKFTCGTNEFLAFEQAAKYFGFEPASRKKLTTTLQAALVAAFKNGPVELPDHGRIREESEAAVPAGQPKEKEGEDH